MRAVLNAQHLTILHCRTIELNLIQLNRIPAIPSTQTSVSLDFEEETETDSRKETNVSRTAGILCW